MQVVAEDYQFQVLLLLEIPDSEQDLNCFALPDTDSGKEDYLGHYYLYKVLKYQFYQKI